MKKELTSYNGGYIMITAIIFFILISTIVIFGMVNPILKQVKISKENYKSKQSYYLANAGIEDLIYRIKNGMEYSTTEVHYLNGSYSTTTITDTPTGKRVTSSASVNNDIRKVQADLVLGTGVAFHYGTQAGQGGFILENSSTVTGNIYANGPVTGSNNYIYGNVVSAGPTGLIDGIHATGSAYANTIQNSTIDKDAYYVNRTSTTVGGVSYPGSPNQATTSFPISDTQIEEWKTHAEAGGTISSPCPYIINSSRTLGPVKINCDLRISGSPTITLNGPVWVNGNIEFNNGPLIQISPSFGTKSVQFIADNPSNRTTSSRIDVNNTAQFQGSGASGSFIFLISQNNSSELGGSVEAISMDNSANGDIILYSNHGLISVNNSAELKQITGYRIRARNTANIIYDIGLPSTLFDSGPGGGFDISSWTEVP